jgi:eukaryotic-like serine/threonine-protein kinase
MRLAGRFLSRVLIPTFLIAATVFFGRAFGYAVYLSYFEQSSEVTVPQVTGLGVEQAQALLSRAGLKLTVDEAHYQDQAPRDQVLSQDPPSGQRAKRGRTVGVEVSLGAEELPVPRLLGQSLDVARRTLENSHLNLGKVTITTQRRGATEGVVRQIPRPGHMVRRGTAVDIVFQTGETAKVTVPKLEGQTFEKAREALGLNNLSLGGVQWVLHEQYEAGLVIRQTPAAESTATPGKAVDLLISAGNDYRQHSLRQRSLQISALHQAGPQELRVTVKDPTGSYLAYEGTHFDGEKITLMVTGVNGGEYEVYINDKLIEHGRI